MTSKLDLRSTLGLPLGCPRPPAHILDMSTISRPRVSRGVRAGGRFVAVPAPEAAINLNPDAEAIDNSPIGVLNRQAWVRSEYRRLNAGRTCPKGNEVALISGWKGEEVASIDFTHPGRMEGFFRCPRCGLQASVTKVWTRGAASNAGQVWRFSGHKVPRT